MTNDEKMVMYLKMLHYTMLTLKSLLPLLRENYIVAKSIDILMDRIIVDLDKIDNE